MKSKKNHSKEEQELCIRDFDGIIISDPFLAPNGDKIRFYSTEKNKITFFGALDNGKKVTVNYVGPLKDIGVVYSIRDFVSGLWGKAKAVASAGLNLISGGGGTGGGSTGGAGSGSCDGVTININGNVSPNGITINCSGSGGATN